MSDEAILLILLFVGLLPGLAVSRSAQLIVVVIAALGAFAFLFIIDSGPDSPLGFWVATVLIGVILGAAIRRFVDRIQRKRAEQYSHG